MGNDVEEAGGNKGDEEVGDGDDDIDYTGEVGKEGREKGNAVKDYGVDAEKLLGCHEAADG